MSPSISARFGGLVMLFDGGPASSITSIDLSGCTRPVMYRPAQIDRGLMGPVGDLHAVVRS